MFLVLPTLIHEEPSWIPLFGFFILLLTFEERDDLYAEFNEEDFIRLVDRMTIYSLTNIFVKFKDGLSRKPE